MKRKKKPKKTAKKFNQPAQEDDRKRKKIEFVIDSLSHGWLPEERETSILFDHNEKTVYLETSYPYTARRWFSNLWGDPDVKWDTSANTLKIQVPWRYCRDADLILKPEFREFDSD